MNKWVSCDSCEWVECHWLLRMHTKNRSHNFYFFMVDHISSTHNMRKAFWVIRQLMTNHVLLWPLIIFATVNCSWNFLSIVISPLQEIKGPFGDWGVFLDLLQIVLNILFPLFIIILLSSLRTWDNLSKCVHVQICKW